LDSNALVEKYWKEKMVLYLTSNLESQRNYNDIEIPYTGSLKYATIFMLHTFRHFYKRFKKNIQ